MRSLASPDRSSDGDERPVRGSQTREWRVRRHLHPEALEDRRSLAIESAPIDPPGATRIRKTDKDVFGDAQVFEQPEVLVDEGQRSGEAPFRGDVLARRSTHR